MDISVGILTAPHIEFEQREQCFLLKNVRIGIGFHWDRHEDQIFEGRLTIRKNADGTETAINTLPLEDYLTSVISSEMSADSPLELLKAHAVISRSWAIRAIGHTEHVGFDVCADDHCQRYQGITVEGRMEVTNAIKATRGQVLAHDDRICDARFSKCCGGVSEEYQYCWENTPKPYLVAVRDGSGKLPDLTDEATANEWIRSAPPSFCNTDDRRILAEVLNDYDQETADFYRWRVEYSQKELATLISEKSKEDFGHIIDLIPLDRGKSGRIWRLKIVGSKKTLIIGKELEIRRTLSKSHLYSSAFVVDRDDIDADGIPQRFVITGAGWGHGVGLCQIGAAVMSDEGFSYDNILLHYYRGAEIKKLYE